MRAYRGFALIAAAAGLTWLSGCETNTRLGDLVSAKPAQDQTASLDSASADPVSTGSLTASATPGLLGDDPKDDLNLGKKHFRAGNWGLAENHFRRAVELHPRDAEAWIGLAAAYDRLRRFELADRAYKQVVMIIGPTPEVLNNQGYSYILRGDYRRARETLVAAQIKDPANPYIKNNLELLEQSYRQGKSVQ